MDPPLEPDYAIARSLCHNFSCDIHEFRFSAPKSELPNRLGHRSQTFVV